MHTLCAWIFLKIWEKLRTDLIKISTNFYKNRINFSALLTLLHIISYYAHFLCTDFSENFRKVSFDPQKFFPKISERSDEPLKSLVKKTSYFGPFWRPNYNLVPRKLGPTLKFCNFMFLTSSLDPQLSFKTNQNLLAPLFWIL